MKKLQIFLIILGVIVIFLLIPQINNMRIDAGKYNCNKDEDCVGTIENALSCCASYGGFDYYYSKEYAMKIARNAIIKNGYAKIACSCSYENISRYITHGACVQNKCVKTISCEKDDDCSSTEVSCDTSIFPNCHTDRGQIYGVNCINRTCTLTDKNFVCLNDKCYSIGYLKRANISLSPT